MISRSTHKRQNQEADVTSAETVPLALTYVSNASRAALLCSLHAFRREQSTRSLKLSNSNSAALYFQGGGFGVPEKHWSPGNLVQCFPSRRMGRCLLLGGDGGQALPRWLPLTVMSHAGLTARNFPGFGRSS